MGCAELRRTAAAAQAVGAAHHRQAPAGGETVADVGCGTGRDAGHLLQLLPAGRVLAIDGSQQMLAQTRSRLAAAPARRTG